MFEYTFVCSGHLNPYRNCKLEIETSKNCPWWLISYIKQRLSVKLLNGKFEVKYFDDPDIVLVEDKNTDELLNFIIKFKPSEARLKDIRLTSYLIYWKDEFEHTEDYAIASSDKDDSGYDSFS